VRTRAFRSPHLPARIAVLEGLGFAAVVLVIWLDELLDLPHSLLGAPPTPLRLEEAILESVLVIALGTGVVSLSLKMYLQSFVSLCAWCRRVNAESRWISFEEFLAEHRSTTSHGICPDCARRLEESGNA